MTAIEQFKSLYCVPNNFTLTEYQPSFEGAQYSASSFKLNQKFVHFRAAKITPTKIGQFVTFWNRNNVGVTQPYDQQDDFDALLVLVRTEQQIGLFTFPKQTLIDYKIVSNKRVGGKRGFRVYPLWDRPDNKQAMKTQQWQRQYFVLLG